MHDLILHIEATVYPTEDEEKVALAIHEIFPRLRLESIPLDERKLVLGEAAGTESLERLRMMIRSRRIRNTVKSLLLPRISENALTFYLNKQAASARRLSFCEEENETPLGSIRVTIVCKSPREVVEWLTE